MEAKNYLIIYEIENVFLRKEIKGHNSVLDFINKNNLEFKNKFKILAITEVIENYLIL